MRNKKNMERTYPMVIGASKEPCEICGNKPGRNCHRIELPGYEDDLVVACESCEDVILWAWNK